MLPLLWIPLLQALKRAEDDANRFEKKHGRGSANVHLKGYETKEEEKAVEEDAALREAIARKNRLLNFDKTSAERTQVLDDQVRAIEDYQGGRKSSG